MHIFLTRGLVAAMLAMACSTAPAASIERDTRIFQPRLEVPESVAKPSSEDKPGRIMKTPRKRPTLQPLPLEPYEDVVLKCWLRKLGPLVPDINTPPGPSYRVTLTHKITSDATIPVGTTLRYTTDFENLYDIVLSRSLAPGQSISVLNPATTLETASTLHPRVLRRLDIVTSFAPMFVVAHAIRRATHAWPPVGF